MRANYYYVQAPVATVTLSGGYKPQYLNSGSFSGSVGSGSYTGSLTTGSYTGSFGTGSRSGSGTIITASFNSGSQLTASIQNGTYISLSFAANGRITCSLASGSKIVGLIAPKGVFSGSWGYGSPYTTGSFVNDSYFSGSPWQGRITTASLTQQSYFTCSFASASSMMGWLLGPAMLWTYFSGPSQITGSLTGSFTGSFGTGSSFTGSISSGSYLSSSTFREIHAHACPALTVLDLDYNRNLRIIDIVSCSNFTNLSLNNNTSLQEVTMSLNSAFATMSLTSAGMSGSALNSLFIAIYSQSLYQTHGGLIEATGSFTASMSPQGRYAYQMLQRSQSWVVEIDSWTSVSQPPYYDPNPPARMEEAAPAPEA